MLTRARDHSEKMEAAGLGRLSRGWIGPRDPPRWWMEHQKWIRTSTANTTPSRAPFQVIEGGGETSSPAPVPLEVIGAVWDEDVALPAAVVVTLPDSPDRRVLVIAPSSIPHLRIRAYPRGNDAQMVLPDGAGDGGETLVPLPEGRWTELPRVTSTTELRFAVGIYSGAASSLTLMAEYR